MRCPSCGEPAPAGSSFCEGCGADLAPGPAAATMPSGPVPVCVSCGEHAVGADGYCGSCGHKQPGPRDHLELADGVVVAVTDKGIRHHDNEDATAIAALPGGGAVLVVCDGVSSTPGSAQASQAAADAARDLLVAQLTAVPPVRVDEALVAAAAVGQERAAEVAAPVVPASHPYASGGPPSSTFVAAVARPLDGEIHLDVSWVGDSRAYWVAGGMATALTDDHELGGSLIRWLGADSIDPSPELTHLTAPGPGRLLVVSDGLWRYAEPAPALAQLIGGLEVDHKTTHDLAVALVDHALAGGGHDNITVAIWDSADEHDRPPPVEGQPPAEAPVEPPVEPSTSGGNPEHE